MSDRPARVAVLGATGSVGRSALDVIRMSGGRLRAFGLSTHRRLRELAQLARELDPQWLVVADPEADTAESSWGLPTEMRISRGSSALVELATAPEVDTVLAAIVGIAGLESTWAALQAGKRVALANKETLVVAGPLLREVLQQSGAELLPVDSEHSAIFQGLAAGKRGQLRRVVLTASGGPFRDFSPADLAEVTLEQALDHPTWSMGPKITIDSATMMNKALEMVEARWLFDLQPDQIEVAIHPQSIVHSMVEFVDGSILAQMSPPDMRLPIQYALTFPERWPCPAPRLDFHRSWELRFEPPDLDRFPALGLGWEVARVGGTAGAVLNAANEAAVQAFIAGRIRFTQIVPACAAVLQHHEFDERPTLDDLFRLDRWAREEVMRWVCT